jgi:hypothetical protein
LCAIFWRDKTFHGFVKAFFLAVLVKMVYNQFERFGGEVDTMAQKTYAHLGFRATETERAEIERITSKYDVSQSAILRTWIREGMERLQKGEPLILRPIVDVGTRERDAA